MKLLYFTSGVPLYLLVYKMKFMGARSFDIDHTHLFWFSYWHLCPVKSLTGRRLYGFSRKPLWVLNTCWWTTLGKPLFLIRVCPSLEIMKMAPKLGSRWTPLCPAIYRHKSQSKIEIDNETTEDLSMKDILEVQCNWMFDIFLIHKHLGKNK
jgi:hypothetical protein